MRGVVFLGDRRIAMREFPDPAPGPGDVVVAIRASGMCGSDLRPYRAAPRAPADAAGTPASSAAPPTPANTAAAPTSKNHDAARPGEMVSGHEPCGVIAAVGQGVTEQQARVGQRVMVHHYRGCGVCKHCRVGYSQMCIHGAAVMGFSANGANAPYLLAPASAMVTLPDELTFSEGAAIACGTGTAYSALKRLAVSGRDSLAIFGQGPVGLAATQLARAMGARVIAIDLSAERRELATQLGADVTVDPSQGDAVTQIRDLTHGEGADATLDCTGNAEARANCAKAARPWGRVCFVGEQGTATFDMTPDVIHKQLTMYGSWTFSTVLMAECAQFAVDRRVRIGQVFTESFTIDQADEAFRAFDRQTMGKGVFTF